MAPLGGDVVLDLDGVGLYHADANGATLIAPQVHTLNGFQAAGGHQLISVGSGNGPFELWTTDGTSSGSHQLRVDVGLAFERACRSAVNLSSERMDLTTLGATPASPARPAFGEPTVPMPAHPVRCRAGRCSANSHFPG